MSMKRNVCLAFYTLLDSALFAADCPQRSPSPSAKGTREYRRSAGPFYIKKPVPPQVLLSLLLLLLLVPFS